jgi:subtilisin family serine protease
MLKKAFFVLGALGFSSVGFAGQYIVQFRSHDKARVEQEVVRAGGQVLRSMEHLTALVVNLPEQAASRMASRMSGVEITPDITLSISRGSGKPSGDGGTSVPPPQEVPWGISRTRAQEVHSLTKGDGVRVCVVDTGVQPNHPDLAANIVGGRNFTVKRGKVSPSQWADENGHGTHVAGTIAALDNSEGVLGVAPQAEIYVVRVLDRSGAGSLSSVTDGVYECLAAGSHVINMSLGATADPSLDSPLKTAVATAIAAGVHVIVAAGNESNSISNTVPAGFPGVVAVGAMDSAERIASFSNYGLGLKDLAAPGVAVKSTWLNGGYNTISGTSMAAPHVAGVMALLVSMGYQSTEDMQARDLGLSVSSQGRGLVDAALSLLP